MKNQNQRYLSFILAMAMILTAVFTVIVVPATAASYPTTYSSDSNSGTRDVICTSLSGTSASSYYTGSYTYDNLSKQSQSQIKASLGTLMSSTHRYTSSYDDCHDEADKTDCENNNGKISLIYTSYSATMSQWNGWNREHVWPQSLGGDNTKGGGADLHHIRPSDASVNSSRSNKKYGNATGGSEVYGKNPATGCLGGTGTSTYFEPLDNVKGDVARICLYVHVRWGSAWGADSITKVFQSVDVLLDWMELDPVDTWEMGRNEVVQGIQGNRNVFIDYPEYAWLIFGEEIPEGYQTPSGSKGSTTATTQKPAEDVTEGGNGGSDIVPGDTVTYTFSDYTAGTANAENEVHKLDDELTVTVNKGFFTTELRIYAKDSQAVFEAKEKICSLSINAGYKDTTLKVYGSDDGSAWTELKSLSVTSSYDDHDIDLGGKAYKYIKLETTGAQVRVKSATVGFGTGGAVTPPPETDASAEETTEKVEAPTEPIPEGEYSIPEVLEAAKGTDVVVRGTVKVINTAWNTQYNNISVTITDKAGNELYIYRLKTDVKVGDIIIVTGTTDEYNGKKQIGADATAEIIGHEEIVVTYDKVTVAEANASSDGRLVTFTATVTDIANEWSESYGNMNVTVTDENGDSIYLYRLATKVALGDIITVKGIVGSYNGAKQIAAGSTAEIIGHESETTPEETKPVETDPIETDPIETDPVETDPIETDPIETDPVETDSVETDPVETDPIETDPIETDSIETDSIETDPIETDPAETDPVETNPVETDPVETDPVETDPVETDPAETDPVETDPVETDPVETDPIETDPAVTDPEETTVEETTVEETTAEETTVEETIPIERDTTEDTTAPDETEGESETEAAVIVVGCASSVGTGASVLMIVSLAGALMIKRKKNKE